MKTEAYKEAQKRYDVKKTKFYGVKLNIETDAELIKALDASDNRQGLIKKAIRSYLVTGYEWYKSRGICPNCKCRKLQPNRSRCGARE